MPPQTSDRQCSIIICIGLLANLYELICFAPGSEAMLKGGYVDWVIEVMIPENEVEKCRNRRDCWIYRRAELSLRDYDYTIRKVNSW